MSCIILNFNLLYQTRDTLDKSSTKEKLSDDDIQTVQTATETLQTHIEDNQSASLEELGAWEKEFTQVINPVMSKLYQTGPSQEMPTDMPPHTEMPNFEDNGPTIDEVD